MFFARFRAEGSRSSPVSAPRGHVLRRFSRRGVTFFHGPWLRSFEVEGRYWMRAPARRSFPTASLMPSALPDGDAAPADGALPAAALADLGRQPFGIYVHVPFCTVRCGYCDFNTYTAIELGTERGSSRATYAAAAIDEIRQARRVLGDRDVPVHTVFFGGGTPTLLPPRDLASILEAIRHEFGLAEGAEVTTESNPDSVTAADLEALRAAGINRLSLGMQSVDPQVLGVLDRTHDPARVPDVVRWARAGGFDQVSLDLIYGTPGESMESWERTLAAAAALEPDHVSAYALIVEAGTALARRVARGDVAMTDDDDLADKYELADEWLSRSGLGWYEVSNWARNPRSVCRHNVGYWRSADWWGVGPGAHSHVSGVRWWNVRHPAAYAQRIAGRQSPAAAREVLDPETRRVERVLLESRLVSGLDLDVLDAAGRQAVPALVDEGLVTLVPARRSPVEESPSSHPARPSPAEGSASSQVALVLTRRGRLLADAVVRSLLP
jgi:putative oxygen-independent coproporphyrinogen III oxidase